MWALELAGGPSFWLLLNLKMESSSWGVQQLPTSSQDSNAFPAHYFFTPRHAPSTRKWQQVFISSPFSRGSSGRRSGNSQPDRFSQERTFLEFTMPTIQNTPAQNTKPLAMITCGSRNHVLPRRGACRGASTSTRPYRQQPRSHGRLTTHQPTLSTAVFGRPAKNHY